jgi:phage-related protein
MMRYFNRELAGRDAERDGIARALYVPASGQRLVVVHAFVKRTRRTPARALRVAFQRAKEVR